MNKDTCCPKCRDTDAVVHHCDCHPLSLGHQVGHTQPASEETSITKKNVEDLWGGVIQAYKENPPTPEKQEWEEEFYERFCVPSEGFLAKLNEAYVGDSPALKADAKASDLLTLISRLLSQTRKETLEEVKKMVEEVSWNAHVNCIPDECCAGKSVRAILTRLSDEQKDHA